MSGEFHLNEVSRSYERIENWRKERKVTETPRFDGSNVMWRADILKSEYDIASINESSQAGTGRGKTRGQCMKMFV